MTPDKAPASPGVATTTPSRPQDVLRGEHPIATDAGLVNVWVMANDPRFTPTESVFVSVEGSEIRLGQLEALHSELRDDLEWGMGYLVDLEKSGGGIGASGMEVTSLILGVVGAVPTLIQLLEKLKRQAPSPGGRDEAWDTATWAVALQYRTVARRDLVARRVDKHADHWAFEIGLADSPDTFHVEVIGSRNGPLVATRVMWIDGDPGRTPGMG